MEKEKNFFLVKNENMSLKEFEFKEKFKNLNILDNVMKLNSCTQGCVAKL